MCDTGKHSPVSCWRISLSWNTDLMFFTEKMAERKKKKMKKGKKKATTEILHKKVQARAKSSSFKGKTTEFKMHDWALFFLLSFFPLFVQSLLS